MKSPVTASAFFVPVAILALGLGYAFLAPLHPNDWVGGGIIVRIALTLIVASLASVILSAWAFQRSEGRAPRTLFLSIPGSFFLIWLGFFFIENYTRERRVKREEQVYSVAYTELQHNPLIIRSKDWSNVSGPERRALRNALELGAADFVENDLLFIYETYPSYRLAAFKHPVFPGRLLAQHFDEAWDLCESGRSYNMLAAICSNTNTPRELLERVAVSRTLPVGAVHPAQRTLEKINAERDGGGKRDK